MARELYSAILEKTTDGWGVSFPHFPGCVSFGRSPKEAQMNAAEALALHLEGMMEDGEDVPYEGDPDEALLHASGGTGGTTYPVFVSVDLPDGSERVNVYLPKHLISRVDRFAGQYGMNRSSVFGNAIRRYLETENDPKFWEKKVEEVLRKSG